MGKSVLFLANGFEEVEALTCADYLRRAQCDLVLCGVAEKSVVGSHGIKVECDCEVSDVAEEDFDAVILPGGMPGAANLAENPVVEKILRRAVEADKVVAAICAAPVVVLGRFGLLKGKNFTCYAGMENNFARFCGADWKDKNAGMKRQQARVVQDGKLITACGPGAAEEFALKIIENLFGAEKAAEIKKGLLARQ